MSALQLLIFSFVIFGFIIALWIATRNMKRKRKFQFQNRPDMSEEGFYFEYYKDSGILKEDVFHVLKMVAEAIEIPASKIRPSDRFNKELAPVRGWEFDDGIAEITWFVKDIMKKRGETEMMKINTVDDLIKYVAQSKTR